MLLFRTIMNVDVTLITKNFGAEILLSLLRYVYYSEEEKKHGKLGVSFCDVPIL